MSIFTNSHYVTIDDCSLLLNMSIENGLFSYEGNTFADVVIVCTNESEAVTVFSELYNLNYFIHNHQDKRQEFDEMIEYHRDINKSKGEMLIDIFLVEDRQNGDFTQSVTFNNSVHTIDHFSGASMFLITSDTFINYNRLARFLDSRLTQNNKL